VVLVLIGGGIGSVFRYLASVAAGRAFGDGFGWGTLIVNLVGCLLIGFIVGCVDRAFLAKTFRILLVSGFIGGFTTFSSFSLESVRFLQDNFAKGLANILLNVLGGLTLTLVGLWVADKI